jgi:chromate transporter
MNSPKPCDESRRLTMPDIKVTTRSIFLVFLKIGTFAFGGLYSVLAFIEKELVHKKKWIKDEDFAESVVIGQLTPGPPIVNTGIFIGYSLKGIRGGFATVAGQVLPSFLMILIFSYLFMKYRDIPLLQSMLKGVGAAVVGLIASTIYSMCKSSLREYKSISLAIIIFICMALFKFNPIILIIVSGIAGCLFFRGGDS